MNVSVKTPPGEKPGEKITAAGPIPIASAGLPAGAAEGARPGRVHVVTMSKGGAGKTTVAWNLTQYLRDAGRTVVGVDLDVMSHSLQQYAGLGARVVRLLHGEDMALNGPAMDALAEDIITAGAGGTDFVLDNGVSGFTALTRYLLENERAIWQDGFADRLVIHAVLGGGAMSAQCLLGLDTLLEAFARVKCVLWL